MKKIGTIMLGLLVVTTFLGACKKKEVVGPTGPAGAAGNANVKSFTVATVAADWTGDQVAGYSITLSVPIITADIVATGAVMCYLEYGGTTYALPYSYLYGGGYTRHMLFNYELGTLTVDRVDDDGLTVNPGSSSTKIKVVAISSTGLIQHPNVDLTNYEEVKQAFNL
ncbi:MAG: hypothetical protein K0S23_1266 [Fluviicola sp.]|jgi:hypothetical protein|uniref:hypothetical protein n=1 Tax=Fluviicola sp. TaxID=1917219 RepID=UPI0026252694|nr:hypothetical protein [Fluviicola sp.]MDF3026959.1 hypothetical protein [Fluviicola sp.]